MDCKEKLERAKELYQTANADQKYVLESLFPELAESEGERIRKHLIDCVTRTIPEADAFKEISKEQILAWLEKQGETSEQIHYWTEEEIEPIISDYLRGAEHYGGMIARLRCLKPKPLEKQGEQKLANSAKTCKKSQRMVSAEAKEALYDKPTWSEEDDVRLQACLDTLQAKSLMGVVDTNMTKWLKSLKQRIGG